MPHNYAHLGKITPYIYVCEKQIKKQLNIVLFKQTLGWFIINNNLQLYNDICDNNWQTMINCKLFWRKSIKINTPFILLHFCTYVAVWCLVEVIANLTAQAIWSQYLKLWHVERCVLLFALLPCCACRLGQCWFVSPKLNTLSWHKFWTGKPQIHT